eukprot:TRINITY_DN75288_c0_g1_i1.p1 TRINITY_DN75288_c0_g1~~TRINITY_DN75288_c0_g1_i1.p1  ORF type:complete len:172 (-),score=30.74 TRINITY_DN75288_c0_g1_i1:313-828(-)
MPGHRLATRGLPYQAKDGRCYYQCRFCDTWREQSEYSPDELKELRSGTKSEPICKHCARLALLQSPAEADAVEEDTGPESLPVESRYAFIAAFTGEYEDIPEMPVDVLHRILTFVVSRPAPFIADLGDGLFRCTACMRDFTGLSAALQHTRTSQRHVRALKAAAGEKPAGK